MRHFIIDTDAGSDDAVALLMALQDDDIDVLGITSVAGNIGLAQATANALMTIQVAGKSTPVYPGADRPLVRRPITAVNVHGQDGMGDLDLIHPQAKAEEKKAVDYILETVRQYDDVEIVALGPATNIALAILTDRSAMSRVKRIYTMGTSGLGPGNTTPVAEFNVYADPESYSILLNSGIPLTIAGFDICLSAAWNQQDIDEIKNYGPIGAFAIASNSKLLAYNDVKWHKVMIDLPDAVAMACALDEAVIAAEADVYAVCCLTEGPCYGQVVFYNPQETLAIANPIPGLNAVLVTAIDQAGYKKMLASRLRQK